MKIIIVGCGKVGQTLAEKLCNDGNEITVIDLSPAKVAAVTNRVDVMGVVGNGAKHSTLREAQIASAQLFIAVTDSDELNLLCCMIAKGCISAKRKTACFFGKLLLVKVCKILDLGNMCG